MREIQFRYVWERPTRYAGPYSPSDPKVQLVYLSLRELEDGKFPNRPRVYGQDRMLLGEYSTLIARDEYAELKDKNGKEIYEGDILGGIWEGGYIAWCDKCKSLQYFADYNDGCQKCSGDTFWEEIVEDGGKLEVIGNIYESKELLS